VITPEYTRLAVIPEAEHHRSKPQNSLGSNNIAKLTSLVLPLNKRDETRIAKTFSSEASAKRS
jgi:hypothetical protein